MRRFLRAGHLPRRAAVLTAVAAVVAMVLAAHPGGNPAAARPHQPPGPQLGDPLPGLTQEELDLFHAGKEAFEEVEGAADGVGPVFNGASCAECHASPATGGGSDVLSTRIGAMINGRFDALERLGGPTIQTQGVVGLQGFRFRGEVVPKQATIVAKRRATPVFGFGLVEAVPDVDLVFLSVLQHLVTPDTAGRPNFVRNLRTGFPAVGRFGWKAQIATLTDFAGDAYKDEMGITTPGWFRSGDGRLIDEENAPQGNAALLKFNPVTSPNEPDIEDVILFRNFMRFLAPPPRGPVTPAVRAGETLFLSIGCANCHAPTLQTSPSTVAALDRKEFHPYSDFLLHDMGPLGDGIEQGTGRGSEMRTAPLWGLREHSFLIHDGRAATVELAILMHRGQGQGARDRFNALTRRQKDNLLAFLNSL
jgi:CxxC motif-containing protein (DUF1111 family)